MTDVVIAHHPGCFGAASVFALDCATCDACASREACRVQAHERLNRIKGSINVEDILKRHQKARIAAGLPKVRVVKPAPVPTPPPVPMVERVTPAEQVKFDVSAQDQATIDKVGNTKAREVATSLARNNQLEFVATSIRRGHNPFTHVRTHANLRIATDMLLQGGFTKKALAERYVSELGWSEGTAGPQRSQALQLLQALGVVREVNGTFILKQGPQ